MSDSNIVLVTADLAPWESGDTSEPIVLAFSGSDKATTFVEQARAYLEPFGSDINVAVYDPEPVHWFTEPEGALKFLKGWLDLEEDDDTTAPAVPAGD